MTFGQQPRGPTQLVRVNMNPVNIILGQLMAHDFLTLSSSALGVPLLYIFELGINLKMAWIAASRVVTFVEHAHAFGNWPASKFPGYSVSFCHYTLSILFDIKLPVSCAV